MNKFQKNIFFMFIQHIIDTEKEIAFFDFLKIESSHVWVRGRHDAIHSGPYPPEDADFYQLNSEDSVRDLPSWEDFIEEASSEIEEFLEKNDLRIFLSK